MCSSNPKPIFSSARVAISRAVASASSCCLTKPTWSSPTGRAATSRTSTGASTSTTTWARDRRCSATRIRRRRGGRAQLPKGTTYYFLNEPAIRLAERLVEAFPCADAVHYTGSGTEATFFALRIARAATGRNKVLKFEGAWHGMHDYGLWGTVPSQPRSYPCAKPDSVGIPDALQGQVLVAPFNDAERAVPIIDEHAADLAAVIVEPLQRVLLPEPGFLEALREVTRRHGIVLVFDEIVTGFRIAWGGAQERYGVVPDLACYGKAMSRRLPDGGDRRPRRGDGVLDARRIARAQAGLGQRHAQRQSGLRHRRLRRARRAVATRRLRPPAPGRRPAARGIDAVGARHGFAVQTPGEDAVFGVRFTDREALRTWMDLITADKDLGQRWALELIKRGLLVNPNEKFYISIPHTDADVDRTLEAVEAAFRMKRTRK